MDFNSAWRQRSLNARAQQAADRALDLFFEQYYRSHPVNATFTGVHTYDTRLPDWSLAGVARDAAELDALRLQLEAELSGLEGDYRALSNDPAALDGVLALANIRLRLLEHTSQHFQTRNPALWTGEAIFGVVSLMVRDFAPPAERLPAIAARLKAIPEFLHTMRERITLPVPERWRDRAVRECSAAVELFGSGLEGWLGEHSPDDGEAQRAVEHLPDAGLPGQPTDHDPNVATRDVLSDFATVRAAARAARDAYHELREWLVASETVDASSYAIGEPLFSEILRHGHFCNEAPRELLRRAEAALQHERERLGQLLDSRAAPATDAGRSANPRRASGPRNSDPALDDPLRHWGDAQAAIAADHPVTRDYYESFARRWQEIHDAVGARDVVTWPHWPIRYVPVPAWAQTAAPQLYWLFYRSPAPFDAYSTYEYVVTPVEDTMPADEQEKRLALWNHSAITLNHVVHHGGVGHHVQNWNAVHRSSSRVGTVAAVDCASRIGMFLGGSMAEGWACYATELVEELGLLTELETLSQQHTRVRQLARAVVDIRLHTGSWSFAECAEFYAEQTGMTPEAANAETTKNSMFPGTALMYWLGTQGILDLRTRVQTLRGAGFNLRAFHDELLGRGSIPVLLVAGLMLSALDHAAAPSP